MQNDPKRRAVGSVADAADIVKARLSGRLPRLALTTRTGLGNFPGLGLVARERFQGSPQELRPEGRALGRVRRGLPVHPVHPQARPRHGSPVVLVEPPVPGGLVQTISGAVVVMPARPLRGIRAVVKPEDTRLIGRPRAW